jgi:predicted ATPase
MELVPGHNLSDVISRGVPTIEEGLQIARQVAAALEAAHKRGVIHRDLKPMNVMVTSEGRAKVLDFGLAKAIVGQSGNALPDATPIADADVSATDIETEVAIPRKDGLDLTGPERAVGTPGYMSPEQLRGGTVDIRTDTWAFGCLVYECLTGSRAFSGKTREDRIRATLHAEPALDRLPAAVPGRLRRVIESILAKDAGSRTTTISEARRTIEETLDGWKLERLLSERETEKAPTIARNNLPRQLTSFIGREAEIAEVGSLIHGRPLVTLTGVGGGGKTRLALEVARACLNDYVDGTWLVELAAISDPLLVPQAAMSALEIDADPGKSPTEAIVDHVRDRRLLVVLDNCEHVLEACMKLSTEIVQAAPGSRILATSREPLAIDGETAYPVPPLSTAVAADERTGEAVRLFVDRAHSANPSFDLDASNIAVVTEICRRLDGIPLALELAAARMKVLSAEELASRLDQRFKILTGGKKTALPRHQTLRGLIDWSHDQLDEKEQALLRRLSAFAGGWTLEAAEAVCAYGSIEAWELLDLFTQLVDKSLVVRDPERSEQGGQTRYRMLETVREYASERLEQANEVNESKRRHGHYFVTLAEFAASQLDGRDQAQWLARLATDHGNFDRVVENSCEVEDGALGLRLVAALFRYWQVRGHWGEGRTACATVLAHPRAAERSDGRAAALRTAGILAWYQGDHVAARALCEESLAIKREIGDRQSWDTEPASRSRSTTWETSNGDRVTTRKRAPTTRRAWRSSASWGTDRGWPHRSIIWGYWSGT